MLDDIYKILNSGIPSEKREKVIFTGVADGQDIVKLVLNNTGIDISKSPEKYRIRMIDSGITDGEGTADNVYGEYEIIELEDIREPFPPKPEPPEPKPPKPEPPVQNPNEDKDEEKLQDMLDKYYGNSKKEKEYRTRIKRFKSHIVEEDFSYENNQGEMIDGKRKNIEDYPEKSEDEEFLQLEEFQKRLMRVSEYQAGKTDDYEEIAENIIGLGLAKQEERENLIQEMIQSDIDYIETNNFAYNQRASTQTNLMTMGKYGEKVPYLPVKDKNIGQKILNGMANTYFFLRNNISANLHTLAGTYVAAPVHKLLFNPNKVAVGTYKGSATHRYTARKDYFEKKYERELEKENERRSAKGEKIKNPNILRLVFGTRLEAIFKYKEGNIAVLSTQAEEIKKSAEIVRESKQREEKIKEKYENIKREIAENVEKLKAEKENAQTSEEKKALSEKIDIELIRLSMLPQKEKEEIIKNKAGFIQKDPTSLEQHDKANKSNMTRVITGVKMAVAAVASYYIGQNLKEWVEEKTTDVIHHDEVIIPGKKLPDKIIPGEKLPDTVIPGEITQESLADMKLTDLISETENKLLTYDALDKGNSVAKAGKLNVRGLAFEDSNGNLISGSDGIGFSISGRTNFQIPEISSDATVWDVMSNILNQSGNKVTPDEIIKQVLSSSDPQKKLEEMFADIRVWVSPSKEGMPQGWLNISDVLGERVKKMLEAQIIPGGYGPDQVIPGGFAPDTIIPAWDEYIVSTELVEVINYRVAALMGALGIKEVSDLYDLLRRVKGKEEMEKEGTHTKEILPHQKDNHRGREYVKGNRYGFSGTEKEDRKVWDERRFLEGPEL